MKEFPEILLIDKPKGITSFDVIRRLRSQYSAEHDGKKAPKMGHAGTLDPLASGLMVIGIGHGTKKLSELTKLDKEYIAEVRIGERRSTGDLEGRVLEEVRVSTLDITQVQQVLESMIATLTLPVSAYSAIKKDGVPMYKRARQAEASGEVLTEVPIRDMEVLEAELLSLTWTDDNCVLTVRFVVRSGVYVRSLAEELGRRLGYPATLQNLRRTKVGHFSVTEARTLE